MKMQRRRHSIGFEYVGDRVLDRLEGIALPNVVLNVVVSSSTAAQTTPGHK